MRPSVQLRGSNSTTRRSLQPSLLETRSIWSRDFRWEAVRSPCKKLFADLATVWEAQGESVLRRLAIEESRQAGNDRVRAVASRDVFISVEQWTPGNLEPDEWAILRRVIDLIQANAKAAELGPVPETIENALQADQAKMIEAKMSGAAGREPTATPCRQ
jgi:hypothetical protein